MRDMMCFSLQACQNDGGDNIWGIASVNSVLWGDVSTPGYTFTISYENKAQNKKSQVSYTLDTSGGTQFTVTGEQPANTYVSRCSFFSMCQFYI